MYFFWKLEWYKYAFTQQIDTNWVMEIKKLVLHSQEIQQRPSLPQQTPSLPSNCSSFAIETSTTPSMSITLPKMGPFLHCAHSAYSPWSMTLRRNSTWSHSLGDYEICWHILTQIKDNIKSTSCSLHFFKTCRNAMFFPQSCRCMLVASNLDLERRSPSSHLCGGLLYYKMYTFHHLLRSKPTMRSAYFR